MRGKGAFPKLYIMRNIIRTALLSLLFGLGAFPLCAQEGAPASFEYLSDFEQMAANGYRRYDNYIAFHAIRPKYRISWHNSQEVLTSYAKNILAKKISGRSHPMGHVTFEVGCTIDGTKYRVVSGQSEESMDEFVENLKEGEGFNLFFANVPGKLQTEEDISEEYSVLMKKKNRMAVGVFVVDEGGCKKAMDFFSKYEASGAYKKYGLTVKPLEFEGGGCASLGAAVIQSGAGPCPAFAAEDEKWQYFIKVPLDGFGSGEKKVKLKKLLFKNFSFNLDNVKPGININFYDPHKMFDWVHAAYISENYPRRVENYYLGKSPVVILDYRK